jgi:hypothetical protein
MAFVSKMIAIFNASFFNLRDAVFHYDELSHGDASVISACDDEHMASKFSNQITQIVLTVSMLNQKLTKT